MKKILRYTARGAAVFIGVLVLVYLVAYVYVISNRKEIIYQIKEQVAEKLNGEVQIGNISLGFLASFPSISVELEKVLIRDTLFNEHKHPFFEAAKVNATISFLNLIQRNNPINGIRVEDGQVYIYTDTSGYTNSYLLSPKSGQTKTKKKSTAKTEIESIKFKNVRLVLDDRKKKKLYDFAVHRFTSKLKNTDSTIRLKTSADILIHNFAFNTDQGSFVLETPFEGDFILLVNKPGKQLSFNDIDVNLKEHSYNLSGIFSFTDSPSFALKVSSKDVVYEEAKSLLSPKIQKGLSLVKLQKPVNEVTADISGPLKGGDPLVLIKWKVKDNSIQSPFAAFTECTLEGSFTNELVAGLPRKDPNSQLHFQNFSGNFEGLKVTSKNIYIANLEVPDISADLKTDFDLSQLNNLLGSSTLDFHEGNATANLTYTGPLQHNSNKNTSINGKISFSNGLVMYHPRNLPINNVSGNIVFKNTDVYVTDFRGTVQGNKIVMNGSGKNLLALMNTSPGKMFVDWNVYSPALNLNTLTFLLKKRAGTAQRSTGKSKLGSTAGNIDKIVNQANFRLAVTTNRLTYKRFTATDVKASVGLVNENWFLNTVRLSHAGGSMAISGNLTEKNSRYYGSTLKVNMENVDVSKVMYAFNDFGQNGISHQNLRGKLSSVVDVTMDIDRDLQSTPANMHGFIDFSLKKGALLNYEPLEKIQQIAFKKRNFSEIHFAELKDRLDIKDREIMLNRMEIQSTVLTLYVEGVYSLRGKTDISIQIPLSNLKTRDNFKLENKGAESKGGASIFVRGQTGSDGNVQFKLDLFKKFRRKDKDKDKAASDTSQVKT